MGPAGSRGHRPKDTADLGGLMGPGECVCVRIRSASVRVPPPWPSRPPALPPAPCPRPSTPRPHGFPGEFGPHVSVHAVNSQLVSVPVAAVDRMLVSPQFTR